MHKFSLVINKRIQDFKKTISVDSDKSCSIRFFLIASNACGISRGYNVLESEDVKACINSLRSLGVKIVKKNSCYNVYGFGLGSFIIKKNLTLNFKNSGTLGRLLPAFLVSYPKKVRLIGDTSLSKRDFKRVINPLEKMGAKFLPKNKYKLPLNIVGSEMPIPIDYTETKGSAQIKSLIQLAALNTPGITTIKAKKSRDHTEILLRRMKKVPIKINKKLNYDFIEIKGQHDFGAFDMKIPGDISSASFFICLAILSKNSEIKIKNVGINPTRIGIITILKKMNANIIVQNKKKISGELVGDIIAKSSPKLKSINCPSSLNSLAIDEFVLIFLVAARSKGKSFFKNLSELRGKESDRLGLFSKILNNIGIKTKLRKDSIKIYGNPNLTLNKKYTIYSREDHRIVMTAAICALTMGGNFKILNAEMISTSFPSFLKLIKLLGGKYETK